MIENESNINNLIYLISGNSCFVERFTVDSFLIGGIIILNIKNLINC